MIASIAIEQGERTLSPNWQAYGDAVELNFQAYLRNTAINVFNLFLRQ